ncbi:SDR family NAD(P)-dependent oxidoreductase [Ammoniphilus sp. 3BR4]|uniref:SDR family NAD(P)-dependent oxidoreductase n=1 Tax=Ammoniphilus sp. 3BR4 TaxID=3158265 RepID=UPI0034667A2F
MKLFEGKTAIVTGGARGIGEATVRQLLDQGANVAIFDVTADGVRRKFPGDEDRILAISVDVRNLGDVEKAVQYVEETFHGIDILVNNAGVLQDHFIEEMTEEDWDKVIDVNLKGSFNCCKAVTPYMKRQKYGKMVMVSSLAALGAIARVNYASAKAGIQGMTRALAMELGHSGIFVNAVAPGYIETEMSKVSEASASQRGITDFDSFKKSFLAKNPIPRVGKPEDVANVIEFLASAKSDYVTGQIIYVSGSPGGV